MDEKNFGRETKRALAAGENEGEAGDRLPDSWSAGQAANCNAIRAAGTARHPSSAATKPTPSLCLFFDY